MAFNQTIEIIDVSPAEEVKGAKSTYKTTQVAFKDETGKVDGKKLLSFKGENVFAQVLRLQRGDKVTVAKEKDAQGYWQWIGINSGSAESAPAKGAVVDSPAPARANPVSGNGTGRVTGSNYETAEERKVKQRYIVRQSSISAALTFAELTKMPKPSIDSILDVAKEFESYVFGDNVPNEAVINMPDDIPV